MIRSIPKINIGMKLKRKLKFFLKYEKWTLLNQSIKIDKILNLVCNVQIKLIKQQIKLKPNAIATFTFNLKCFNFEGLNNQS